MLAIHTASDAFAGGDCARLLETLTEAPSRDAGLVAVTRGARHSLTVWCHGAPFP